MMSFRVMLLLLAIYAVILLAAVCERHWWLALYFTGAIIISISVIGMTWKEE